MLLSETRFPDDISYGAVGGPEFSTDIITTKNGHEQRNVNWSFARIKYNVSHGIKNKKQLSQLIEFFRARKGMAYGFRFKGWMDYQSIKQEIGIGDGHTEEFQLIKSYSDYTRTINKPVRNTVRLFLNKEEHIKGYTVNY